MVARETRRLLAYIGLVVVTTAAFTVVYRTGMASWENEPRGWFHALEVVVQTFTTTGYGQDAPWSTPQMEVLIIVMQLAGLGLILTALDVFAVPWLRNAISAAPPTSAPDAEDHVVLCKYTSRGEVFTWRLDAHDDPYVVVEEDRERAMDLYEAGRPVVHGDPESVRTLENASVGDARAVVADAADDRNASIALSATETNPDARVVTLVEDRELAEYHRLAGADEVLSPRQLLGESMANRVPTAVTAATEGVQLGDDIELVEVSVEPDSDLHSRPFADSGVRERYGVHVVGAWFDGTFESPVPPDATLDEEVTLLVAGDREHLSELREATAAPVREFGSRSVVVAGYGDSGTAAAAALAESDADVTVVDLEAADRVDVVGDASDPDVQEAAGVPDATAMLVAVGDDTTAVLATLVARDLNPEMELVVRANERDNVRKLYRAGADYVESLADVSGRMMVSTAFEDEEVLGYSRQIDVVKLSPGSLVGRSLSTPTVREETGCVVVAVERDGETIVELADESFQFRAGDRVVVAGTDDSVAAFRRRYLE